MPKMSGILNEPFQEVTGYARQAEQVSTPKLHVVPDQQPLPGVSDDALGRI
jgi:hypothetical protein